MLNYGTVIYGLWEFIKKFAYVFILIYIPYVLIGLECPLIKANQELTIIYMLFMLSGYIKSF